MDNLLVFLEAYTYFFESISQNLTTIWNLREPKSTDFKFMKLTAEEVLKTFLSEKKLPLLWNAKQKLLTKTHNQAYYYALGYYSLLSHIESFIS